MNQIKTTKSLNSAELPRSFSYFHLAVAAAVMVVATVAGAPQLSYADSCSDHQRVVDIENTVASASTWGNVRNSKGSLRFESSRLLTRAVDARDTTPPQGFSCPAGCVVPKSPEVVFRSVPQKFLTDYSEKAHCDQLQAQTSKSPLLYPKRSFQDGTELNSWFGDFSQGKGKDGKDLYAKCDGDCSPQYTCTVTHGTGSGLTVDASVLCGPARDKDDNNYRLSVAYRWACVAQ